MRIAFIAPRLPPAIDGLGDYCRGLWEAWPTARPDWTFLVADGARESQSAWPEVRIAAFERSAEGLARSLEDVGATAVALQYVGYGYDARGCPAWLPDGLRRWRVARPGRRLCVMFHELWAAGPPWRRAFWTHRAQVRIARDLAGCADTILTSTRAATRRLGAAGGVAPRVLPIPSNVPVLRRCWEEPVDAGAALRVLLFGQAASRLAAIERHGELLAELAARGRLERIVVVGGGLRAGDDTSDEARRLSRRLGRGRVAIAGELPGAEVSRHIGACHLALSATPAHLLTKSSAAMAAIAHGCPVAAPEASEPAELPAGAVFAHDGSRRASRSLAGELDVGRLRQAGLAARAWYLEHADWRAVAAAWRQIVEGMA